MGLSSTAEASATRTPTMKCVKYSKQLQIYGRQHTRDQDQTRPLCTPSLCHLFVFSSTPTTRSSSLALASKSACNSIKMQKDFNASGTSKWSVCSPVSARCQCVYVVCIPCIGSKGCVCHVPEKLIKVLPFICY